jgi:hypothetical protein
VEKREWMQRNVSKVVPLYLHCTHIVVPVLTITEDMVGLICSEIDTVFDSDTIQLYHLFFLEPPEGYGVIPTDKSLTSSQRAAFILKRSAELLGTTFAFTHLVDKKTVRTLSLPLIPSLISYTYSETDHC